MSPWIRNLGDVRVQRFLNIWSVEIHLGVVRRARVVTGRSLVPSGLFTSHQTCTPIISIFHHIDVCTFSFLVMKEITNYNQMWTHEFGEQPGRNAVNDRTLAGAAAEVAVHALGSV